MKNEKWSKHMIRLWCGVSATSPNTMPKWFCFNFLMTNPLKRKIFVVQDRVKYLFDYNRNKCTQRKRERVWENERVIHTYMQWIGSVELVFLKGNLIRIVEYVLKNQIATNRYILERSIPINLENQKSKNCNRFFSHNLCFFFFFLLHIYTRCSVAVAFISTTIDILITYLETIRNWTSLFFFVIYIVDVVHSLSSVSFIHMNVFLFYLSFLLYTHICVLVLFFFCCRPTLRHESGSDIIHICSSVC